jgi:homoserine dehydrogenase
MREECIRLGLLGCGTVGTGVATLISENARDIQSRIGAPLEIHRMLVRDTARQRGPGIDPKKLTTDPNQVLDDSYIDIIVEVMGGVDPTLDFVETAITRNKHVVTANKALIATHGTQLFDEARQRGVTIRFEAAVAGGIPIIRSLHEGLASDRVQRIVAILNGTSNYILSKMSHDGIDFDTALQSAQDKGYAEADPSLDIGGQDAAQKLTILSHLGLGTPLDGGTHVHLEGIKHLTPRDLTNAAHLGFAVKPLAIAVREEGGVSARVHPTMVPVNSLLGQVHDVFNAVHITSESLGPTLLFGPGAGMMPTAVAVVSDVIEAARALVNGPTVSSLGPASPLEMQPFAQPGAFVSQHYLRFTVVDKPGVLATLSNALGSQNISISSMFQDGQASGDDPVEIVVCTHKASAMDVTQAVAVIDHLDIVLQPTVTVRIEAEF